MIVINSPWGQIIIPPMHEVTVALVLKIEDGLESRLVYCLE